ncbi:unnamed protein product [Effrenium voratum]|uniref:Malonyl-CoA:ACP transacylase (MAT) domain-containing protein n=1 Tax=Effrenium voratum TaxID=2562239 RepID=A0AA36MNG1_9DINO|nr:unnamed protein product [Effrenium voratum]
MSRHWDGPGRSHRGGCPAGGTWSAQRGATLAWSWQDQPGPPGGGSRLRRAREGDVQPAAWRSVCQPSLCRAESSPGAGDPGVVPGNCLCGEPLPWKGLGRRRVSSFGFGGTNAHAILKHSKQDSQGSGPLHEARQVAMLFTGQSEIRPELAKELLNDVAFREALQRCATLCTSYLDRNLLDIILDPQLSRSSALRSFAACFSLQFAMVELWRAKGVRPKAVLGHSLGEFAAAVAAGVMSLEDGLRLVTARGRLLDERCEEGAMAALFTSLAQVQAAHPEKLRLCIAAINGPSQVVVSGSRPDVEAMCQRFPGKSKMLDSRFAMHSMLPEVVAGVREEIKACTFGLPKVQFVSCMTGSLASEELTTADYWLSHDTATPVNFLAAMKALDATGCDTFVEIGPRPLLLRLGQSCCQAPGHLWLSTVTPERPAGESLVSTARALKAAVAALQPSCFPWVKPLVHPLLGQWKAESKCFRSKCPLSDSDGSAAARLFRQHRVLGEAVLPGASHLLLMAAAHLETQSPLPGGRFIELQDVTFQRAFVMPHDDPLTTEVMLEQEGLQILSRSKTEGQIHAQCRLARDWWEGQKPKDRCSTAWRNGKQSVSRSLRTPTGCWRGAGFTTGQALEASALGP